MNPKNGTMDIEKNVVAIEISSSKIIVAVGRAQEGGVLEIVASEQEKGVEGVRYGVIQNLEDTSLRINRILGILERKPILAPRRVTGMYVGLSCRSLRSIATTVSMELPNETEITDEILTRLREQALMSSVDSSLVVVDAVPRSYKIGGRNETITPKGVVGDSITAVFDLVVCRPEIQRNILRTIQDKVGIPVRGVVITPLATGQLILTSEQKRLGCMLVDMGAETTTVTIYKGGHLVYFATIPLGGRNITRDITSLNILEERAEEIKITSGNAVPRDSVSTLSYNGVRDSDVSNLIVARAEEIVVNILEQIRYANLKDQDLAAGIICIGGGSRLNGIMDLLQSKSRLNVMRGQLPNYISVKDTTMSQIESIEVASVLYVGAMNSNGEDCLEQPKREELPVNGERDEEPVVEKPVRSRGGERGGVLGNLGRKMGNWLANLYSGNNSDEDNSDILD